MTIVYQLIDYLRDKELLILLDNCDAILQTSSEKNKFREFLELFLANCQKVKILVTSRIPLTTSGYLGDWSEKIYNLLTLSLEDSKNLFLLRAPR